MLYEMPKKIRYHLRWLYLRFNLYPCDGMVFETYTYPCDGTCWRHLRVTHSCEAGRRWRRLTLTPTLMMGRRWWHLRLTLYPCDGTVLEAFETNTSCGGRALATFQGNPYPCGGMALAAFEVVTPTSNMAMPTGHCQDRFVRGACGSGSAIV